jgi:hypothetical protein
MKSLALLRRQGPRHRRLHCICFSSNLLLRPLEQGDTASQGLVGLASPSSSTAGPNVLHDLLSMLHNTPLIAQQSCVSQHSCYGDPSIMPQPLRRPPSCWRGVRALSSSTVQPTTSACCLLNPPSNSTGPRGVVDTRTNTPKIFDPDATP